MTDTEVVEARLGRFREVCGRWFGHVPTENGWHESTAEEDALDYLLGRKPLRRFCVVAGGGENVYLYPDADTLPAAAAVMEGKAQPDTWSEGLVEVLDLDTGERWEPVWESLQFRPAQ